MEHCLWGDRVFQVRIALLFVTPNLFLNSKVILIKIQLVIKRKCITVAIKQLYKETSMRAVRSYHSQVGSSFCCEEHPHISVFCSRFETLSTFFIRDSYIFRSSEICSLISGFDNRGRLAHIFHCWSARLRSLTEKHSARVLVFLWFSGTHKITCPSLSFVSSHRTKLDH